MKKLIAALLASVALGFAGGAIAEDKPEAPVAVVAAPAASAPAEVKVEAPVAAPAAAVAAPAEAAPAPVPNKGDNAWLMVSTAFVILMCIPGLALFSGGMVRAKNMLSVLRQVMTVFSLNALLFAIYGYSLAFTDLFGYDKSDGSQYYDLGAAVDIGYGVTLAAHVGYNDIKGQDDYTDWKLGLSKEYGGFNFGLHYVDTDVNNSDLADERVILSVSKSF